MNIKIEQLIDSNNKHFKKICEWQIGWWGKEQQSDKVIEFMTRCLNKDEIPLTYIATYDEVVVGMYQIAMYDDIEIRPDYYPWLINVYIDEAYRGKGICNLLMEHAKQTFKNLKLQKMYLYTDHFNLYEKYGWKYLEDVQKFSGKIKRIYYLDIDY